MRYVKNISERYELQTEESSGLVPGRYLATGQQCLVRVLSKERIAKHEVSMRKVAKRLVKLCTLDHPGILRSLELLEDASNFYVVYPSHQSLLTYLAAQSTPSEARYADLAWQLLNALAFAHARQVFHCRLDLDCLFVLSSSGDLGIACFEAQVLGRPKRHPLAQAPECLNGETSSKADVWSCGIILHQLLYGVAPFSALKYTSMLGAGKALKVEQPENSELSLEAWSFLKCMLAWKAENRASVLQCLRHPWLELRTAPHASLVPLRNTIVPHSSTSLRAVLRNAVKHFIMFRVGHCSELDSLTHMFRMLDVDGDGRVSESELVKGLNQMLPLEVAQARAREAMETVDTNHSGFIDYTEFLLSSANEKTLLSPANVLAAFTALDHDGNGTISLRELRDVFFIDVTWNKEQLWGQLLKAADKNGSGEVDYEEFQALVS